MTRPHFCGVGAGPRTVFCIEAKKGYSIKQLSFFGEDEAELVFQPLTLLRVQYAIKRILDPKYGLGAEDR